MTRDLDYDPSKHLDDDDRRNVVQGNDVNFMHDAESAGDVNIERIYRCVFFSPPT